MHGGTWHNSNHERSFDRNTRGSLRCEPAFGAWYLESRRRTVQTKMHADLSTFLRTGKLGTLELGSSPENVRAKLGVPDDYTPEGAEPVIWQYGNCELMFASAGLFSIELKPREDKGWSALKFERDPAEALAELSVDCFEQQAAILGLTIVRRTTPSYMPEATIFELANDVRVVFEGKRVLVVSALDLSLYPSRG